MPPVNLSCALLVALSCIPACGVTRLTVRVDPPRNEPKAGFYAGIGEPGEQCANTGKVTDDEGLSVVTERWCGQAQLVVAAPGYKTHRQALDTCDIKFVRVEMHKAEPLTNPTDECSTAAMRVMAIWLSRDAEALRNELVDPDDLEMYMRERSEDPWQVAFEPITQDGDECSVQARMFYDVGCEGRRRIDLLRVRDSWRLRGIQD